jgi:hypothetical protein
MSVKFSMMVKVYFEETLLQYKVGEISPVKFFVLLTKFTGIKRNV